MGRRAKWRKSAKSFVLIPNKIVEGEKVIPEPHDVSEKENKIEKRKKKRYIEKKGKQEDGHPGPKPFFQITKKLRTIPNEKLFYIDTIGNLGSKANRKRLGKDEVKDMSKKKRQKIIARKVDAEKKIDLKKKNDVERNTHQDSVQRNLQDINIGEVAIQLQKNQTSKTELSLRPKAKHLKMGDTVMLAGLKENPELNGREGHVIHVYKNKYDICFDSGSIRRKVSKHFLVQTLPQSKFKVGTRLLATRRNSGNGKKHEASIQEINEDGTYTIKYSNGDIRLHCPADAMKLNKKTYNFCRAFTWF